MTQPQIKVQNDKRTKEFLYNLMLGDLLPLILHDINNPITALQGFPDFLEMSKEKHIPLEKLATEMRIAINRLLEVSVSAGRVLNQSIRVQNMAMHTVQSLLDFIGVKFRQCRVRIQPELSNLHKSKTVESREVILLIYTALEIVFQILQACKSEIKDTGMHLWFQGDDNKFTLDFLEHTDAFATMIDHLQLHQTSPIEHFPFDSVNLQFFKLWAKQIAMDKTLTINWLLRDDKISGLTLSF